MKLRLTLRGKLFLVAGQSLGGFGNNFARYWQALSFPDIFLVASQTLSIGRVCQSSSQRVHRSFQSCALLLS